MLARFLPGAGRASSRTGTWAPCSRSRSRKIRAQVGPEDHVICALSGGVDSAVAATLVHRAIGDRLHCVFVDHGLLRFEERERVMEMFDEQLHLPVRCVDASERFLTKLAGVSDPERKRKIIGAEFIDVFEDAAKDLAEEAWPACRRFSCRARCIRT